MLRDDVKWHNRPENLYWGDIHDNARDAIKNGRTARGERVGGAVFTENDVYWIKWGLAYGVSQRKLAAIYGVFPSRISKIARGEIWAHI